MAVNSQSVMGASEKVYVHRPGCGALLQGELQSLLVLIPQHSERGRALYIDMGSNVGYTKQMTNTYYRNNNGNAMYSHDRLIVNS